MRGPFQCILSLYPNPNKRTKTHEHMKNNIFLYAYFGSSKATNISALWMGPRAFSTILQASLHVIRCHQDGQCPDRPQRTPAQISKTYLAGEAGKCFFLVPGTFTNAKWMLAQKFNLWVPVPKHTMSVRGSLLSYPPQANTELPKRHV